jgi:hypothetical protein
MADETNSKTVWMDYAAEERSAKENPERDGNKSDRRPIGPVMIVGGRETWLQGGTGVRLTLESVKAIVACNYIYRLATVTARRTARRKTRTSCSIAWRIFAARVSREYCVEERSFSFETAAIELTCEKAVLVFHNRAARTIRPERRVVNLDGQVYEKLIHNGHGRKPHVKSVALSGAGVGNN